MTISKLRAIRASLNAAADRDWADNTDPMAINSQANDALFAEIMATPIDRHLLECEDAVRFAESRGLTQSNARQLVCEFLSERPLGYPIYEVAEAIFSAAGWSESMAWDAGHIGIVPELARYGNQLMVIVR